MASGRNLGSMPTDSSNASSATCRKALRTVLRRWLKAVATNCESCMQWHIEQAATGGASEREVFEAVEVGIEMAGGPGTVAARFALEVMESVFPK